MSRYRTIVTTETVANVISENFAFFMRLGLKTADSLINTTSGPLFFLRKVNRVSHASARAKIVSHEETPRIAPCVPQGHKVIECL